MTARPPVRVRPRLRRRAVWFFVSPAAARAEALGVAARLRAAIREREFAGLEPPAAEQPAPEPIARSVRRALAAGCRRFVVAGGDGSVGMVASALARHARRYPSAALGIVPAGTANVLARELSIPLDPDEAIALALDGRHATAIDAMRVGDRHVFTQLGVGLDAQMIRHTSRASQIARGRLAYVAALLDRAWRHRPGRFELEVDGRVHRFRAWQVLVANAATLGTPPFTWGPGIDPADGRLDVCVYQAEGWRDALAFVPRVLFARHRRDARSRFLGAARRVAIRARGSHLVQGDGEILGRTPVTIELEPGAVRIRVPRAVPAAEPATPSAGADAPGIIGDAERLIAARRPIWVVQGAWRHPLAYLAALDAALYGRVNALRPGRAAERALLLLSDVMHYGEGWALLAAGWIVREPRGGLHAAVKALPVLWITMLIVNVPLKRLFRRPRPFRVTAKARVLGRVPRDHSFPSGHTAAAFAGALLFSRDLPGATPLLYAIAVLVGWSRVQLGVHYPGDVLAGAIAGTGLAALLRLLLQPFWPW